MGHGGRNTLYVTVTNTGSIYSLDDTAPLRYNKESLVNPRFACRSKWFGD